MFCCPCLKQTPANSPSNREPLIQQATRSAANLGSPPSHPRETTMARNTQDVNPPLFCGTGPSVPKNVSKEAPEKPTSVSPKSPHQRIINDRNNRLLEVFNYYCNLPDVKRWHNGANKNEEGVDPNKNARTHFLNSLEDKIKKERTDRLYLEFDSTNAPPWIIVNSAQHDSHITQQGDTNDAPQFDECQFEIEGCSTNNEQSFYAKANDTRSESKLAEDELDCKQNIPIFDTTSELDTETACIKEYLTTLPPKLDIFESSEPYMIHGFKCLRELTLTHIGRGSMTIDAMPALAEAFISIPYSSTTVTIRNCPTLTNLNINAAQSVLSLEDLRYLTSTETSGQICRI